MFNFESVTEFALNPQNILERLSEEEIYRMYFPGKFSIGTHHAPYRKDNTSSLSFYIKDKRIKWKDFKPGEGGGDVFDFVCKMQHCDLPEAMDHIYRTMIRGKLVSKPFVPTINVSKDTESIPADIRVVDEPMDSQDLLYWMNHNISRDILELYRTGRAKEVYLKGELWSSYRDINPVYYYHYPVSDHLKIYKPKEKNKKRKWLSNTNNDQDIDGYYQCDIKNRCPELLILTKARKEVMFYRSFDLDAMAIQGEGHHFNPDFIRHIKKYCKKIISQYDNDEAGVRSSLHLWRTYRIPGILVPRRWGGAKDPTDLWKVNKPKAQEFLRKIKNGIYS